MLQFFNNQQIEHICYEWSLLKFKIYDEKFCIDSLKALSWADINRKYRTELPNLLILIDLVLTLPASSAECERGFSGMKRIKSSERSSLGQQSLDDLLMIYMNSKSVSQFDPTTAIEFWLTRKNRYLNRLNVSKEHSDSDSEEDESLNESSDASDDE